MVLDLTDRERDFLLELLDSAHREKLHELHHADSAEYKRLLKGRVELIETLRARLTAETASR